MYVSSVFFSVQLVQLHLFIPDKLVSASWTKSKIMFVVIVDVSNLLCICTCVLTSINICILELYTCKNALYIHLQVHLFVN